MVSYHLQAHGPYIAFYCGHWSQYIDNVPAKPAVTRNQTQGAWVELSVLYNWVTIYLHQLHHTEHMTCMASTEAMQDDSFLMEFPVDPQQSSDGIKSSCWNQMYPTRADADMHAAL